MKIFNLDSPFMQGLSRMADLLILNLIAGICCIPIVTIGASMTALHYMSLKMVRNEECYIVKGFFKSFKDNFKQATIIWLIFLVAIAIIFLDFTIMNNLGESVNGVVRILITIVGVIILFTLTFVFPTLAKFDNPVWRTIKNAFVISVLQFPKAIVMIALNIVPLAILLTSVRWAPLPLFFGLSVPAYVGAMLYNKFFKKLEEQIEAANAGETPAAEQGEDTDRIFHDEVDEGISLDENRY